MVGLGGGLAFLFMMVFYFGAVAFVLYLLWSMAASLKRIADKIDRLPIHAQQGDNSTTER